MTNFWKRIPSGTALLLSAVLLGACADPVSMVASSVLSAAIQTGIETAQRNRADPEKLWQQAQLAHVEQLAIGGNSDAQFQLGIYYLLRREPGSVDWICQAANQDHARAQLQYGHFFNEDRKRDDLFPFIAITPDNVQAFVWYSLSANKGDPRGVLFRDSLKQSGLNSQHLHEALAAINSWMPTPCGYPRNIAQQPSSPTTPNN